MGDTRKPWQNESGCNDPTAYAAVQSVTRDEHQLEHRVGHLVSTIKAMVDLAGFELVGRIHIRHKKTRKEFK